MIMAKHRTNEAITDLVNILKKSQAVCENKMCDGCKYKNQKDCELKLMAEGALYFGYGDVSCYKKRIKQMGDDFYYRELKLQDEIKKAYDTGFDDGEASMLSDMEQVQTSAMAQIKAIKATLGGLQTTLKKLSAEEVKQ